MHCSSLLVNKPYTLAPVWGWNVSISLFMAAAFHSYKLCLQTSILSSCLFLFFTAFYTYFSPWTSLPKSTEMRAWNLAFPSTNCPLPSDAQTAGTGPRTREHEPHPGQVASLARSAAAMWDAGAATTGAVGWPRRPGKLMWSAKWVPSLLSGGHFLDLKPRPSPCLWLLTTSKRWREGFKSRIFVPIP